jgi:hypothetical protein
MGEHYMTEQGIPIPTMTELQKVSAFSPTSLALPLFGTLGLMALMSHDYGTRVEQGIPVGHPYLPTSRRWLDKVEQFAHEHPLITAGAGTLALHRLGGTRALQALKSRVGAPVAGAAGRLKERAQAAMKGFTEGTTKMSEWLGDDLPTPHDTVMLPAVDIDKIAERIGEVIVEA